MDINGQIDITDGQRATLLALLARYLPETVTWVYGSRVTGKANPRSDLDLVVFASPEQQRQVADLREALEESDLPFRVDLFVWDEMPESFKANIKKEKVCLTAGKNCSASSEPSIALVPNSPNSPD
jgi:predicted nucleotidyltransferase